MKKERKGLKKALKGICALFIAFTPVILTNTASILFFGEPESPKYLSNKIL